MVTTHSRHSCAMRRSESDPTPASTIAEPIHCSADSRSSKNSTPQTSAKTGCTSSRIDVSSAGSRGSAVAISSQPITCDTSASNASHRWAGHDGAKREARIEGRAQQRADGHADRRVEQRTRRRGECAVRRAEHQQKDGVTGAGRRPSATPAIGADPYASVGPGRT